MAILPNKGLVYGRQIGKNRTESVLSRPRGSSEILLAKNGSAEPNIDPHGAIQKIISREKPDIAMACKPNPKLVRMKKWAPVHTKQNVGVEDVILEKMNSAIGFKDISSSNAEPDSYSTCVIVDENSNGYHV